MKCDRVCLTLIFLLQFWLNIHAANKKIVVAKDGSGDYKTIQGALNSILHSSPVTVFVKSGIYQEKIYLEKSHVTIEGEDRETTVIIASISRDEWRCGHTDDWGVATLNVGASDITLLNITITNSFGFDFQPRSFYCASDTGSEKVSVLRKDGHQMALRTMNGATRLKAVNCHFRAFGGDTVSPWEVDSGFWYFKDCIMEGGVDFYCPRGWAWAENCLFITLTGPAAIWHDGSKHQDSKTILKNCRFVGYDGFMLGRYHRDAQFFLIDCLFGANMKDADIYLVPTSNTIQWGRRVYYADCSKEDGINYTWYKNNLPGEIRKQTITVDWLFGDKWHPEKK